MLSDMEVHYAPFLMLTYICVAGLKPGASQHARRAVSLPLRCTSDLTFLFGKNIHHLLNYSLVFGNAF